MGLARDVAAETLALTYDDIPAEDVHQVKRLLLDSLGCAFGGRDTGVVEALLKTLPLLGGPAEASVLTRAEPASALNAILVNGAMLRFLDMNDVQTSDIAPGPRHGHNSEIFPVVLALCEREDLSGRDLVLGSWLGYEVATRFTEAIPGRSLEARGWNLDSRAAFAAPIVAGRLLGLDAQTTEHAVGIALSRGGVLEVVDHHAEVNSMAKNLRFPLTAHLGVLATYMASQGLTGPLRALEGGAGFVEVVLEGEYDHEHLRGAGFRSRVLQAGMKRFAACFATHGHLSATLDLVLEHDLKPEQVEAVHVRTTTRGARHTGDPSRRHPTNKETADHSSYYVQAAIIADRALGPEQYTRERMEDPEIRRLASAVSIEGDPELDDVYPSARVTITLRDGSTVEHYVGFPPGQPANPLSDADIEQKFRALARPVLSEDAIERCIAAVWAVDTFDRVRDFAAEVVGAA